MSTWGKRNISIDLGDRVFCQSFDIADVCRPILGADFLWNNNNLAVDLRGRRLIDLSSYTVIPTKSARSPTISGIHAIGPDDADLASIIEEFPELLVPQFRANDENLHGV